MEKEYLDNARQIFLRNLSNDIYYEGRHQHSFNDLLQLIGYIIPNKITAEELVIYLQFLINDIKKGICGFHNSKGFEEQFKNYSLYSGNIEMEMTYIPDFVQAVTSEGFYKEFIKLFKNVFYQLYLEEKEQNYGYVEIAEDIIDISNKDKAEVLAALYNHSKPIGVGIAQYDPTPMTVELARMILEKKGYHFDYLKGRTMKIHLDSNVLDVHTYNKDNSEPKLAQIAISKCKNINENPKLKKNLL